jgi:hypothetical protein
MDSQQQQIDAVEPVAEQTPAMSPAEQQASDLCAAVTEVLVHNHALLGQVADQGIQIWRRNVTIALLLFMFAAHLVGRAGAQQLATAMELIMMYGTYHAREDLLNARPI